MVKFSDLVAPKRVEPSNPLLPDISTENETTRKDVYAIGDVAGSPLVKIGLNAGFDLVHQLLPELKIPSKNGEEYDLIIVGSGPCSATLLRKPVTKLIVS